VSDGLYRFSRNPIYVGMIGAMIGIFLIVPAFSNAPDAGSWIGSRSAAEVAIPRPPRHVYISRVPRGGGPF
jgi:hypothetical protein